MPIPPGPVPQMNVAQIAARYSSLSRLPNPAKAASEQVVKRVAQKQETISNPHGKNELVDERVRQMLTEQQGIGSMLNIVG